jgi:hypothetical protein
MYRFEDRIISTSSRVLVGATCDNCGSEMTPVAVNEDGTWQAAQAVGSLDLHLNGGYGQFLDSMHGGVRLVWCKQCANKLCDAFPTISKAINECD